MNKLTLTMLLVLLALVITCAVPGAARAAETAAPASGAEASILPGGCVVLPELAEGTALMDLVWMEAVAERLASPEFEGRRVGTAGCDLSMDYLSGLMQEIGIDKLPEWRDYKSGFSVTEGVRVAGEPKLRIFDSTLGKELTYGSDYVIAPFSGSGSAVDAPLVFAGYGISAPEFNWDDYSGINAAGSILVIVRGEPAEDDPTSLFAGTQPSLYSDLRRKAAYARDMGAVALIVLENPLTAETDELPAPQRTYSATNFDIPVLHLKRAIYEDWTAPRFAGGFVKTLLETRAMQPTLSWPEVFVATAGSPGAAPSSPGNAHPVAQSIAKMSASLDIRVEKDLVTGHNLIGIVPGTDPALAGEYIIIGAHYDHIGHGGMESTKPGRIGEIHPGADDNASGVAAALSIARWAKSQGGLSRSLAIVLFSGEEEGLLGSAALVKNSPLPLDKIHAMLNFDMVGRLRDNSLTLGGTGTAAEFDELLLGAAEAHGLTVVKDASGFGGSDQMSFIREGVPSLFFFSGVHGDYHNPDDTADKLNYEGMGRIATFAAELLQRIDAHVPRLSFVKPAGLAEPGRNRAGLSVTMGTVPSYEDHAEPGFHLSDVRPGGPAAAAGIQGGDIILRILDRRIGNIYDFIYVLQDCVPGQVVPVLIQRGGETLELSVTLEARGVER